jgi:hypothetical protein
MAALPTQALRHVKRAYVRALSPISNNFPLAEYGGPKLDKTTEIDYFN